jgi:hypothetical protein
MIDPTEDRDREIAPTSKDAFDDASNHAVGGPSKDAFGGSSTDSAAHRWRVVVWDVPPAIECGATFRIKVGVTCGAGRGAGAQRVELTDHDGRPVGEATTGEASWPGTSALHFAEVALRAPDTPGLFGWGARLAQDARAPAAEHASAARFSVRSVPAPECLVHVRAVDAATQVPIEGARVVAHPYRGVTNAQGMAELRLARGEYRLFVSGRGYLPFRTSATVDADVAVTAELEADVEPSDAELWS